MATKVELFRMALANIGISSVLASDTEEAKEARICRTYYDTCVETILEAHHWNFARKRVGLSLLTATAPTNWAYAYAYPSDCVACKEIVSAQRVPRNDQRIPYEVCLVDDAKVICTDQEDAELIYTSRVSDPTKWPAVFTRAFCYLLASDITLPMSAKPDIANRCVQAYNMLVSQAAAAALNEGFDGPEPDGEFLASRA